METETKFTGEHEPILVIRTTKNCSKCHGLMNQLERKGVPFKEIPLDQPEGEEELGLVRKVFSGPFINVPVVSYGDDIVDGSRMDKVLAITKAATSAWKKSQVKAA